MKLLLHIAKLQLPNLKEFDNYYSIRFDKLLRKGFWVQGSHAQRIVAGELIFELGYLKLCPIQ